MARKQQANGAPPAAAGDRAFPTPAQAQAQGWPQPQPQPAPTFVPQYPPPGFHPQMMMMPPQMMGMGNGMGYAPSGWRPMGMPHPHMAMMHLQQQQQHGQQQPPPHPPHPPNGGGGGGGIDVANLQQQIQELKQHLAVVEQQKQQERTQVMRLADRLREVQERHQVASTVVPPPPFPHLHAGVISDHLVLRALGVQPSDDGTPADEPDGASAEHSQRLCKAPHLGVSLSATELSFKSATPGSVQELRTILRNESAYPILLREVRFVGPVCEPPPFSCIEDPPSMGTLILPSDELPLTIRCEAPDEVGLSRQWIFALIEATEADQRTVRIASFVLAASAAMYSIHTDSLTSLSPEAHPFFPMDLRGLWTRTPARQIEAPPDNLPKFTVLKKLPLHLAKHDALFSPVLPQTSHMPTAMWKDDVLQWRRRRAEAFSVHPLNSTHTLISRSDPPHHLDMVRIPLDRRLSKVVPHLRMLQSLLLLEEHQMLEDYARMDVFRAEIASNGTKKVPMRRGGMGEVRPWTFTVDVPGLQEQNPPVAHGDLLLLRLDTLPDVEIGLRVVNVTQRTVLVLQPSIGREELLDLVREMSGPHDTLSAGVRDVERLIEGGKKGVLGHLRFRLNRSIMEYMSTTLISLDKLNNQIHEEHQRHAELFHKGKILPATMAATWTLQNAAIPTVVVAMAPEPDDVAKVVPPPGGEGALANLKAVPGRSGEELSLPPYQPQLNPEQLQAVADILRHEHGNAPYLVFGPPGTGKTMVVIETVLQALTTMEEPRILVCAPSNAAADVIARRLHVYFSALEERRRAMAAELAFSGDGSMLAPSKRLMLRLNSQHRLLGSVHPELLPYCFQDNESGGMFTVPELDVLLKFHVVVATCGATRLLYEGGVPNVLHSYGGNGSGNVSSPGVLPGAPYLGVGCRRLDGHFTHILIDEASQGFEPELSLALAFAFPGSSVALIGDHKQLGPMVRSPFCREHGLGMSLLERLMMMPLYGTESRGDAVDETEGDDEAAGATARGERPRIVTKLIRNYRSHAALLELPSRISYGGELVEAADRKVTASMTQWDQLVASDFPLLFYGCQSAHSLYKIDPSSAHPSSSYRNVTEAEKIIELIASLLGVTPKGPEEEEEEEEEGGEEAYGEEGEKGEEEGEEAEEVEEEVMAAEETRVHSPPELRQLARVEAAEAKARASGKGVVTTNDIGVVTPFRAQVLHLRQQFRKRGLGAINVGTVDDYQGQENLIMIISTVVGSASARSVRAMQHGLMSSPQRFNVAITRAKALLVIVGDPNALWEDASWRELLEYSVDNHCYRGCPHPLADRGVEDSSIDVITQLINQHARRTLLGAGNASSFFPGMMGGDSSMWEGDGDGIDEQIGWKVH